MNKSFIILNVSLILLALSFFNITNILFYMTTDVELLKEHNFIYKPFEIIMVTFLGPIVEEVIFRGLFLYKLALRFNIKSAIIITSFVFSILHHDVINSFIFGLVMCILCIKTSSLIFPIIYTV